MRPAVLVCVPALLGLLASCSIQQTYPGAWPLVDPTRVAGCPDVGGSYLSDGVRADPFAAPSSLGALVLHDPLPGAIVRILQYGADSLAITAWREDRQVARRVFSRAAGDLKCTPAGLGLSCGWSQNPEVLALILLHRTVYLAKSTEGDLMVQDVEFSVGLLIVLPFVGTMRSWHRFSPPSE